MLATRERFHLPTAVVDGGLPAHLRKRTCHAKRKNSFVKGGYFVILVCPPLFISGGFLQTPGKTFIDTRKTNVPHGHRPRPAPESSGHILSFAVGSIIRVRPTTHTQTHTRTPPVKPETLLPALHCTTLHCTSPYHQNRLSLASICSSFSLLFLLLLCLAVYHNAFFVAVYCKLHIYGYTNISFISETGEKKKKNATQIIAFLPSLPYINTQKTDTPTDLTG